MNWFVSLLGNPYANIYSNVDVKTMWDAYGMHNSVKAVQVGVPDFLVYKCVDTFLFQHDLELQYVEGMVIASQIRF